MKRARGSDLQQQSTQAPGWLPVEIDPELGGRAVVAGCTTRHGGVSQGAYAALNLGVHVGDDAECVATNRRVLQLEIGAQRIHWLNQVHGCQVIKANSGSCENAPDADAVWTDEPGQALAILTADCVPVLLWDMERTVVGAAHAGWKGLQEGVLGSLVGAMPVSAERLCAWVGPCISQTHYEVGKDVWQHFLDYGEVCVAPHPVDVAKRLLDLAGIAEAQLYSLGAGRVMQSGLCNYQNPDFYSYRRSCQQALKVGPVPHTGRMASVVMLNKGA